MIEIVDQQKKICLRHNQIKNIVDEILRNEKIKQADLSIVFVTDRKIRALNKKYLKHDYVTDVLSFDYCDDDKNLKKNKIDGEIFISTITAYNNSKRLNVNICREIVLYIIHGILHLLDYDDKTVDAKRKMRMKEKKLMGLMGHTLIESISFK